mmetsp:Transcript_16198/g.41585  ORF Transcript_16198/g.41585 Transcript_16198/m.41585 type:complete len:257 (+) Transcript_16198:456-1226(+)
MVAKLVAAVVVAAVLVVNKHNTVGGLVVHNVAHLEVVVAEHGGRGRVLQQALQPLDLAPQPRHIQGVQQVLLPCVLGECDVACLRKPAPDGGKQRRSFLEGHVEGVHLGCFLCNEGRQAGEVDVLQRACGEELLDAAVLEKPKQAGAKRTLRKNLENCGLAVAVKEQIPTIAPQQDSCWVFGRVRDRALEETVGQAALDDADGEVGHANVVPARHNALANVQRRRNHFAHLVGRPREGLKGCVLAGVRHARVLDAV